VDQFGDHLVCCARNNFTHRHAAVQEALAAILTNSGQGFEREVVVPGQPEGDPRPADLLLRTWQDGKPTAVDITVCHGWQEAERASVSRERWRSFLRRREEAKHAKYDGPCQRAGWGFLAMGFGTWGGLGPEGAKLLHRLVKRAAAWQEGDLRAARQDELLQAVGLALMRQVFRLLAGNNAVLGRGQGEDGRAAAGAGV
jgi:hypothetical protein